MPETRTPTMPLTVDYMCDKCGAETRCVAVIPPLDPRGQQKFGHKCTGCGVEFVLPTRYPFIQFVKAGPKARY